MGTLQEYSKQNRFNTLNEQESGLDSIKNYSGPGSNWVVVKYIGRNRDTESYDPAESNFITAIDRLGGESKTVNIVRIGHWGCGWFELIQIDPKDRKALKIAKQISEDLEEYGVLNEEDFFARERESQLEYAQQVCEDLSKAIGVHFDLPKSWIESPVMRTFAIDLNCCCAEYYGNDCAINLYTMREPNADDLERFETCVKQLYIHFGLDNPLVAYFINAFDLIKTGAL